MRWICIFCTSRAAILYYQLTAAVRLFVLQVELRAPVSAGLPDLVMAFLAVSPPRLYSDRLGSFAFSLCFLAIGSHLEELRAPIYGVIWQPPTPENSSAQLCFSAGLQV